MYCETSPLSSGPEVRSPSSSKISSSSSNYWFSIDPEDALLTSLRSSDYSWPSAAVFWKTGESNAQPSHYAHPLCFDYTSPWCARNTGICSRRDRSVSLDRKARARKSFEQSSNSSVAIPGGVVLELPNRFPIPLVFNSIRIPFAGSWQNTSNLLEPTVDRPGLRCWATPRIVYGVSTCFGLNRSLSRLIGSLSLWINTRGASLTSRSSLSQWTDLPSAECSMTSLAESQFPCA